MRPGRRDELIPVWDLPPRKRTWDAGGVALSVTGGVLVLLFLTFNSGMAIYRSLGEGDMGAVISAAIAYFNLVTLFVCVAMYVRAPPGPNYSARRSRLRSAVWLLTMSLTFHYVFEATAATRPTLNGAMLLWAMPAATGVAVFYVFFQADRDRFGAPQEEEM